MNPLLVCTSLIEAQNPALLCMSFSHLCVLVLPAQHKLRNLEAQVAQQQELQGALEAQLDGALHDRDGLEAELR